MLNFLDSDYFPQGQLAVMKTPKRSRPSRWLPFIFLHAVCLGVIFVGTSTLAVWLAVALYFVRMFAITAFYHRYFSHRTFKTSRAAQFVFAILGLTAVQRGPLWWAAHHRNHHRYADKERDVHSPVVDSFLYSHIGWITSDHNMPTDYEQVKDLAKFPELVWLNRFDWFVPVTAMVIIYLVGAGIAAVYPQWHVSGAQFVVWSFISTVVTFHATASINSIAHLFGSRRFDTNDGSKNNFLLALVTLGEGWHNNHHRFPNSARQGIYWWEIDISYYLLQLLQAVGIIWDLEKAPAHTNRDGGTVKPASALAKSSSGS